MYQFGPFRFDSRRQLLLEDDQPVALTPKALHTLQILIERAGEPVGRQELIDAVWPGQFVEEAVLTQNIYTLRQALESSGAQARPLIETLRGRGYCFTAEVESLPTPPEAPRVLAILPFEPLGIGDDGEVLGLAMADALITRLSRLGSVVVRPTHAVRSFVGPATDPFEVARRLRVEAVATGTIRRAGPTLRISAQLLSEHHQAPLWAGHVEATESELFRAEDALFDDMTQALRFDRPRAEGRKKRAPSALAHRAYLRGRYFWNKREARDLEQALRYFQEAIAEDPEHAPAHAGLADTYVLLPFYARAEAADAFPQARAAATRALEIDDQLAAAHTSLAYVRFFYDWKWQQAEDGFQRALEIDPSYATARHWRGFSRQALGLSDEAIPELERAIELDPLSLVVNTDLGLALYFSRHYDQAVDQLQATLELDPSFGYAHFAMALTLCAMDDHSGAIAAAECANASGDNQAMKAVLGYAHAVAGDRDRAIDIARSMEADPATQAGHMALVHAGLDSGDALEWLAKAIDERSRFVLFLGVWPVFDGLRQTPDLARLIERIGL